MKVYFKITDIVYEIFGDIPKQFGGELSEYLSWEEPNGKYKISVQLNAVEEFQPLIGTPIYQGYGYAILKHEEQDLGWFTQEHRIYISKNGDYPTACYIEKSDLRDILTNNDSSKQARTDSPDIVINYIGRENMIMDMMFMEYFSIDRHLSFERAFIVHACYLEHQGEAVIFTAPSGTGKSTQGKLWEKYAGAKVVNGDRCILKLEENQTIKAYSLPFCGSSAINHNISAPVKGIIYLSQGKDNTIKKTHSLELVRKLLAQTTFGAWSQEALLMVMDFWESIMKTVPVMQYSCTPDQEAVDVLASNLKKTNES